MIVDAIKIAYLEDRVEELEERLALLEQKTGNYYTGLRTPKPLTQRVVDRQSDPKVKACMQELVDHQNRKYSGKRDKRTMGHG